MEIDPAYFRPTEVDTQIGNFDKAKERLNWQPRASFKELVCLMVESYLKVNKLDPTKYLKPSETTNLSFVLNRSTPACHKFRSFSKKIAGLIKT